MEWHTRVPQCSCVCALGECRAHGRWRSCAPAPVTCARVTTPTSLSNLTTTATRLRIVALLRYQHCRVRYYHRNVSCSLLVLPHRRQLPTPETGPCVTHDRATNRRRETHAVGYTESVHTRHDRERAGSVTETYYSRERQGERNGERGSKQDRCWPQQPLTRQYYFQPFSGANATRRGVVSQPSSQSQPSANTERTLSLRSRVSSLTTIHATNYQMFTPIPWKFLLLLTSSLSSLSMSSSIPTKCSLCTGGMSVTNWGARVPRPVDINKVSRKCVRESIGEEVEEVV